MLRFHNPGMALLPILLFTLNAPAIAAPVQPPLAERVAQIVNRPELRNAQFGVAVYDLDRHKLVYGLNERKYFLAASTTKTLTEGTTLALLGGDFRFMTPVYRTGAIAADGTLDGDLVLRASGDPDLSQRIGPNDTLAFENEDHSYDGSPDTKAVPGDPLQVLRDLAKQIAGRGVKRVTGRVVVDTTLFPDAGPEPGTGAVVSSIVVNDNIVDVTVTPGTKAGDPVSIAVSPQTPYVTFVNKAATAAAGTERSIELEDDGPDAKGDRTVRIEGTLPAGSSGILYAYDVPSPRRFAEVAFTQALQDAGVQIAMPPADTSVDTGTLTANYTIANVVASHLSPPLREDVKVTLKVSDNLHADLMPYIWAAYKAHASSEYLHTGFDLERRFLRSAALDTQQFVQNDGLGGDAFLQPAVMVRYLEFLRTQPFFADFYRGLPILGVDGTLFNIANGSPAARQVHAKTGTWGAGDRLNRRDVITAKGLVGYMTSADGRHLAFALYLNNLALPHSPDSARTAGQILGELANAAYSCRP
ncbi:MAG: D-alanyl-D-alanine carboxypeptidase/D-alanyl-D-alanine endopeptidase [Vulcanimicrobiaceae bacterium]